MSAPDDTSLHADSSIVDRRRDFVRALAEMLADAVLGAAKQTQESNRGEAEESTGH